MLVISLKERTPTTPSMWPRGGTARPNCCWGECVCMCVCERQAIVKISEKNCFKTSTSSIILYHSKQVWCQTLSPCVQSLETVCLDITGNEWPTPRRGPRKQSLQEDAVVRLSSKWQHGAAERHRAARAVFSESNSRS